MVKRNKSPASPLTPVSRKLPYFCYEKRVHPKTTESKFKKEPIKIISEMKHTVLAENGRRLHKKLVSKPMYFQPNYTNRGKGPRDPKTMKFVKSESATEQAVNEKEEEMEAEISPTTSTPLVDLTQSSSNGSNTSTDAPKTERTQPSIRINRKQPDAVTMDKNDNIEGSRQKRKIIPVTKYGGIHYSNR